MNDDELIDRLRRATADVPPSTLDPEAVLRSSRRRRAGYRSAVAAGCVAAVAGVGAVTPALAEMLPDGGTSGGQAAPAASGVAGCAGPVELEWHGGGTAPVIRHATVIEVTPDGSTRSSEAVAYAAAPFVRTDGRALPDRAVRKVLAVAAEQDEAGIYRDGDLVPAGTALVVDGTGGMVPDEDDGRAIDAWALKPPFEGFAVAADSVPETPESVSAGAAAGTYIAYDQGLQSAVEGRATCANGSWLFELRFQTPQDAGVVACIAPSRAPVEWALQESLCPDGDAVDDGLATDIDPDAAHDLLRTLGLPQD